jgi:hypothetical protein
MKYRNYRSRNAPRRLAKTFVYVVCDDTKTAPNYFKDVGCRLDDSRELKIVPAKYDGISPFDVVKQAIEVKKEQAESADIVWALVDLEMNEEHKNSIRNLRDQAKSGGTQVAFSQPCFEVWVLTHFVDTGRIFANCQAALAEVKSCWEKDFRERPKKKAQVDYRKIAGRVPTARQNARKHTEANSQSWTEIWKIFEPPA